MFKDLDVTFKKVKKFVNVTPVYKAGDLQPEQLQNNEENWDCLNDNKFCMERTFYPPVYFPKEDSERNGQDRLRILSVTKSEDDQNIGTLLGNVAKEAFTSKKGKG